MKIVIISCIFAFTHARIFEIRNNLQGPIWVGILGNYGKPHLENGGFALNQGEVRNVYSADDWAGRFWARTWCNPHTRECETGDCGKRFQCDGAGGKPPVTLVEITLRGHEGLDFYDISLVDGFNVKASIEPFGGSENCIKPGCYVDLNPQCPNDLKVIGSAGYAIACNSACNKYNTDQFCCRGKYGVPATCNPNNWPNFQNSARYFKSNCPQAYSYAYDDPTSTFTCKNANYRIVFS